MGLTMCWHLICIRLCFNHIFICFNHVFICFCFRTMKNCLSSHGKVRLGDIMFMLSNLKFYRALKNRAAILNETFYISNVNTQNTMPPLNKTVLAVIHHSFSFGDYNQIQQATDVHIRVVSCSFFRCSSVYADFAC